MKIIFLVVAIAAGQFSPQHFKTAHEACDYAKKNKGLVYREKMTFSLAQCADENGKVTGCTVWTPHIDGKPSKCVFKGKTVIPKHVEKKEVKEHFEIEEE